MSIQNKIYESFINAMSIEDLEVILAEKKAKGNKESKPLKLQIEDQRAKQYYRDKLLSSGRFVKVDF